MKLIIAAVLCSALFSQTALAETPPTPPAIQYVGAVSIQPSQDAKILADWYQKFGFDLKLYEGGVYYGELKTPAGSFHMAVHRKKDDAPQKSSGSVSVVFRVNDYKGYVALLEKQGLKPESVEGDDESGHFAHYKDPDGNEMTVWGD